jgi:dsDNA-specific endonuclease/ATPase MutS2
VNATINEGRELLRDTISKLKAAKGNVIAVARILASAARNATRLGLELRREAQEIERAVVSIPNDVRAAVEEYIDEARVRLEAIAKEVEQCVRNPPSP